MCGEPPRCVALKPYGRRPAKQLILYEYHIWLNSDANYSRRRLPSLRRRRQPECQSLTCALLNVQLSWSQLCFVADASRRRVCKHTVTRANKQKKKNVIYSQFSDGEETRADDKRIKKKSWRTVGWNKEMKNKARARRRGFLLKSWLGSKVIILTV